MTEWNESKDIALESVSENDFSHMRLKSLTKNVTDNSVFRRKKSKQQMEFNIDTGKETDRDKKLLTCAHGVEKATE